MKLSNDKLVLKVYTPSNQSAMRQDEAPVDIHGWYSIILIFFFKENFNLLNLMVLISLLYHIATHQLLEDKKYLNLFQTQIVK
jgi:hypothetical protein